MIDPPVVIDSSLTMAWCFPAERTPRSVVIRDRIGQTGAAVPAHWSIEVQNAIRVGERRCKVTQGQIFEFVSFIRLQPIEIDQRPLQAFGELLPISRHHGLNAQDAAYVELALRRGLPLATRDEQMAKVARDLGIELLDVS